MLRNIAFILVIWLVSSANSVYYTPCIQSTARTCTYGTNVTDRLLNMKKGGSNVLSTADYDSSFFPCQEYNYNCGYQEESTDFLTVADGVQLNLTYAQLLNIVPSDATLTNTIKPYLGLANDSAKCVSNAFPLQLTEAQSMTMMTGYLNRITANLSSIYNSKRASYCSTWANLNINIKTAVVEMAKYNMNNNFLGGTFWNNFLFNNWAQMSKQLKAQHSEKDCPQCLHSAYLIDSVTTRCNKYQSINFLVDESGSIGAGPFQYARSFLYTYVNQTYDDLSLMSIHFYDTTFDPWVYYGRNRAQILDAIKNKPYRSGGTKTGAAINASVAQIKKANYPKGVPKIMVILTDGVSYDPVLEAANNARANGIILFCVGIGANVDKTQLLQIAGSTSNIVYITSYNGLDILVKLIENYFCKQIIDVDLNDFIQGNKVRVPTSPSYFRVARSTNTLQYYMLSIKYQTDPSTGNQAARQSHFDPFPDDFSEYAKTESYRTGIYTKQYFISPQTPQLIPVKKTETTTQTPSRAFVSIAGNSLNFNISLTTCATLNCSTEREVAASIGSMNPDNNKDGDDSDNTNSSDSNIWVAIAVGITLTGVATAGAVVGLKKYAGTPEEDMGLNQQNPDELGDGDIDRNSAFHDGDNEANSRQSHKKGSHKSNKSHSQGQL